MRDFGAEKNVIEIRDGISGDVHEIYYRPPTNQELAAYQNGLFERSGKKLRNKIFDTRLKFGARIITGFKKGTLGMDGDAFASDAADPDYRSDWKDLLLKHAPDIVSTVAVAAFEGTGVNREAVEIEDPLEE